MAKVKLKKKVVSFAIYMSGICPLAEDYEVWQVLASSFLFSNSVLFRHFHNWQYGEG